MKHRGLYILFGLFLISCTPANNTNGGNTNGNNNQSNTFNNEINVSSENYTEFFTVYNNKTYYNTQITPHVNKHLTYQNVTFNFKSTYQYSKHVSGQGQTTFDETYDYSLTIDETGNAEGKFIDEAHRNYLTNYNSSIFGELISVSGKISISLEGARITRLSNTDSNQSISASWSTGTTDKLVYKANYNYQRSADTDALYSIEKVHVTFTGTVNNVEKTFSYNFYPDIFGQAEVETDVRFSSWLTKQSFSITNGYLIEYM